ncbi:uncharacterized protein BHQ10_002604 [Talaromyces amestolkiae]|uniref:Arrestin-like N-terminal domain-containing protein n=1 Tax=Talaromyces amestolkiae TaxID=1196081 RepID=A0A364KSR4_TALAM|nr:uncharacterized protein BHQ10_002604 [Talaromyces amestolkiae]RAO66592.1 hypothetical protein BHQ10_002604 [Talaromyces amestolkiae]
MPRTEITGGPSLQIDVAKPPSWTFTHGDTVIGTVIRRTPIVAPSATVTITLFGRTKTKITVKKSNGQSTTTHHYRGRWSLIGTESTQILHQGPLHLAPGQASGSNYLSWPFSVTIPTKPPDTLARDHPQEQSYIPVTNLANHQSPGTFYSSGRSGRTRSEAFVEYYLESTLRFNRGGSNESFTATLPISVASFSSGSEPPINREPQQAMFYSTVQSQRLLPGMEKAELTFKQKTQKLFSSSKVPTFGYKVVVQVPRQIQLGDQSPFPFVIQFHANEASISPSIKDTTQKVQLDWVRMILKSDTDLLAPGKFSHSRTHTHDHSLKQDLGLTKAFSNLENRVVFQSTEGSQKVDIGAMFQLILHPSALCLGNRQLTVGPSIYPDFVTYNIKHLHSLMIELSFTVALETKVHKMDVPVRILPPTRLDPSPPEYSKGQ